MNKNILLPLMLALSLPAAASQPAAAPATPATTPAAAPAATPAADAPNLSEDKAMMSYASGVATVRNFTRNNLPFDVEMMIRGMRDVIAGGKLAASEKELTQGLNKLQTELRRNQTANRRSLSEANRKRGTDYLAEYKKKEGVRALPNGVLYTVLKEGTGKKPIESDTVVVSYRGTKIDGVEFDATPVGKTARLHMNQTIIGWREALKQMPAGSKWQMVIPHQLAYGERGVGETIGPGETLVFEVELVEVK